MIKSILLYKEATPGVVPSNPKGYSIKVESFGLKSTQKSEKKQLLGDGRGASRNTYGFESVDGDLGFVLDEDNVPIIMYHTIGAFTSSGDASADDWASSTAYAVGDIVNHSNGMQSLTCKVAGTSGSDEPTVSGVRGATVVDGSVVWIEMPRLKRYKGERADCLESFGVEVEDKNGCPAGESSFSRYVGLYANTLPLSLSGGGQSVSSSVSTVGMKKEDSLLDDNFVNLSAMSGYTHVDTVQSFYSVKDLSVYINGVKAEKTTEVSITSTNNVSMTDALNGEKVEELGQIENSGSIKCLFNTQKYKDAANNGVQSLRLEFKKQNGCMYVVEYPQFEMEKVDKVFETNKTTSLDIPINAFDTQDNKSVKYDIISPLPSY